MAADSVTLSRSCADHQQPAPNSGRFSDFVDKSGIMIRRVTVFLSVTTVLVGTWVLSQGHSKVSACNSYSSQFAGTSTHAECARATSSYFSGVALTMGGVVILALVLFAMAKYSRSRGWKESLPTIPKQQQHVVGTAAR